MARPIRVALIGQKFMGRAHSNAYLKVGKFFDLPRAVEMHTVCGRDQGDLAKFAAQWGWKNKASDWRQVVRDPQIDLVDIGTPNHLHAPMSIAALKAGKVVACEKPLAGSLRDSRAMANAAKGKKTYVWFNYRRCPALAFARQLISKGRLGRLFHVRACYLQSWGGPDVPMSWRFEKKYAGSGAHGDLNAHIVDISRFLTGDRITEISGAISETFIKQRRVESAGPRGGGKRGARRMGRSTVDDCVLFLARFGCGAVASFEATRVATGRLNANQIEINGSKGALHFNFEDMNKLQFFDATKPAAEQGWTTIMCTSAGDHPYAANWWPDAHIIGYEHGFINQAADIILSMSNRRPVVPLADFADAYETDKVLDAALRSAKSGRAVKVS